MEVRQLSNLPDSMSVAHIISDSWVQETGNTIFTFHE